MPAAMPVCAELCALSRKQTRIKELAPAPTCNGCNGAAALASLGIDILDISARSESGAYGCIAALAHVQSIDGILGGAYIKKKAALMAWHKAAAQATIHYGPRVFLTSGSI